VEINPSYKPPGGWVGGQAKKGASSGGIIPIQEKAPTKETETGEKRGRTRYKESKTKMLNEQPGGCRRKEVRKSVKGIAQRRKATASELIRLQNYESRREGGKLRMVKRGGTELTHFFRGGSKDPEKRPNEPGGRKRRKKKKARRLKRTEQGNLPNTRNEKEDGLGGHRR